MKYYISDMHFFHKNVTKEGNNFDNRPFNSLAEMHQYMKEKWNSKITNGDTVYILGDIAMRGTNEELIALVAQLKGRKVLIKGNHDDVSDMRYKNIFEEIYDYKEITDYADQDAYKTHINFIIPLWSQSVKWMRFDGRDIFSCSLSGQVYCQFHQFEGGRGSIPFSCPRCVALWCGRCCDVF